MIRNDEMFRQKVLFSGLEVGDRSFTDIDGVQDWSDGKHFIYLEAKHKNAPVRNGQVTHFNYLWNALAGGIDMTVIVFEHNVEAPGHIIAADCPVVRTMRNGNWRVHDSGLTVKEFLDGLKNNC